MSAPLPRRIVSVVALLTFASGCASTTVLKSNPSGATVKSAAGQVLGTTPYKHEDTNHMMEEQKFTLEMEGYAPKPVTLKRDQWNMGRTVGFGLGGILLFPLWAGILWSQDYQPEYVIELDKGEEKTATTADVPRS